MDAFGFGVSYGVPGTPGFTVVESNDAGRAIDHPLVALLKRALAVAWADVAYSVRPLYKEGILFLPGIRPAVLEAFVRRCSYQFSCIVNFSCCGKRAESTETPPSSPIIN